ncbi:MAG TPA: hypothetical protein VFO39_08645 [Candidatus Sulfotelmatobacter sp.]|nr:hypothetical protein [Candidatus Sulfotelmatobacter sp.]
MPFRVLLTVVVFISTCANALAGTKPEDIVAQHLASIGTAEARAAVKTRGVEGTLQFTVVTGGSGTINGHWQILSDDRKSDFVMKFPNQTWWGEQFVFDGSKVSFATTTQSGQRSPLAAFVASQDPIIREGLLGGELHTGWALENVDRHRVRLDYKGRKKMDGRELDTIEYLYKGNGGMTIRIFFDPETHQHVMTIYSIAIAPSVAGNDIANAQQHERLYSLEERFSNFQTDNGLTLPRQYKLRFSEELQNGRTNVYEWNMTADKVLENPTLDPANFLAK